MPEIQLNQERIDAINAFIGTTVDPELAKHNRYQHGFINGVIAMANVVFGESKPEIEVTEIYADAHASEKALGHEALCLLHAFPAAELLSSDPADLWRKRRDQLLEVWKFNTQSRLMEMNMGEAAEHGIPENGILVADGVEYKFMSKGMLHTLPPVERSSKDGGGLFFHRLIVGPGPSEAAKTLYAEHVISSIQEAGKPLRVCHRRIGVISVPNWLKLEHVEEPCLSE